MEPPYSVEQYTQDHPNCVYVELFLRIPQSNYHSVRNVSNVSRLTAKGDWTNRWNHWEGLGVPWSNVPCEDPDMLFIRMSEETVYVRKLFELLDKLSDAYRDELVHLNCCVYWFPQNQVWFIASHEF